MSFILDALKKSDAKRRAGEQPTLHAAMPQGKPARPTPTPAGLRWALVASVTVAVLASAWAGWLVTRPDRTTEPSRPQPQAGPAVESTPGGEAIEPAPGQSTVEAPPRSAAVAPEQTESTDESTTESTDDRGMTGDEAALDVESANTAPANDDATAVEPPEAVVGEGAEVAEALAEIPLPEQLDSEDDTPQAREDDSGAEETNGSARQDEASWSPDQPNYLRYWELPLSVREALPSLTLNVHVYAPVPENRFVLINGRRLQQGEVFGSGRLRVAEIRPEGALIDFDDYRFLLSQ
ncbi:MAG: general secretion pathway protein GspB [Wenzhouxiangella sp.]|nr:general secretion pathway protein GspB [Wenzhouxiangella sp.]MDR9453494.1 general secretion pathway protein GspB [Wenzhouxiangella sp.]